MDTISWLLGMGLTPYFFFIGIVLIAAACHVYRSRHFSQSWEDTRISSRFLIVVPAHNEEATIGLTVTNLRQQHYPKSLFEVIVIADNCQDLTAKKARDAGARVIERWNLRKRGKGYALEHALLQLEKSSEPWDGIVIIDADSVAEPDMLVHFARNLEKGIDWQQGFYMPSNPDASWRTQLATIALGLFNGVWPMGLDFLGIGSPLRGNGMAFSRRGLRRFGLRAYGLAEDLELGWRLRLAGERVRFVPEAHVRGLMVSVNEYSARTQRLRWEIGRAKVREEFRSKIWLAKQWSLWQRCIAWIDLHFPPLARLGGIFLIAWILALATQMWGVILLLLLQGVIMALYVMSPCWLLALPVRYIKAIAYAPRYALWKAVIFFAPKPETWIRTARE